jgi:hypothetical protein
MFDTMSATLYLPQQSPQEVSDEGLCMPDPNTGLVRVPGQVPPLLVGQITLSTRFLTAKAP